MSVGELQVSPYSSGLTLPNLMAELKSLTKTLYIFWRTEKGLGRQLTYVCLLGSLWELNKAQGGHVTMAFLALSMRISFLKIQ